MCEGEYLDEVDMLCYLIRYILPCVRISKEVFLLTAQARLIFTNLSHAWCRLDIRLSTKGRVCTLAIGSALLSGSEAMTLEP